MMRTTFRQLFGCGQAVGGNYLSLSWIILVTAMLCYSGCGKYMKKPPPKSELCGYWRIDLARTKWEWDDVPHIKNDNQTGYLLLRTDGTFSFKDMPNFGELHPFAPTFHHDGTGKWWTGNNIPDGTAYLWLGIKEMDGQPQDMSGAAYFRWKGSKHKYLLCFMIADPDTGQVLILKKVKKPQIPESK